MPDRTLTRPACSMLAEGGPPKTARQSRLHVAGRWPTEQTGQGSRIERMPRANRVAGAQQRVSFSANAASEGRRSTLRSLQFKPQRQRTRKSVHTNRSVVASSSLPRLANEFIADRLDAEADKSRYRARPKGICEADHGPKGSSARTHEYQYGQAQVDNQPLGVRAYDRHIR